LEKHLLELKGVEVRYGDVQAVWDVSFHVNDGAVVALLGANGAGKTTLLKTISGILRPNQGEILFSGKSLVKLKPQDVVDIGISHVPEGRRLFTRLSVLENLELGAYPRKFRPFFEESLGRAYKLFPILKERSHQKAGLLSGGEQQMLAIARAIMARPALLMLDEPSLGLSPLFVKAMFELIRTLNDQKVTILLVEQNIHQALKIAHDGFVLKTGKIVMSGKGNELLANPEIQKAYMGTLG
jgi:branched-chain amino acid transport system ATP-binding protein